MQPSNELSTTQQRPGYMIDEFYNIGRVTSPVRIFVEAETRHGRGIGLRPDVTANVLRQYGKLIEFIIEQAQSEDEIDYDII